ncbi:hypothetical protein BBW65_02640 [Helicobacter enhydrae]|uniref:Lipoprotein n=1 Tax=Helicobacter enhydrae TaxID=222136 RepID=A0A1B1U4Z5_9HELI|nr:LPS assembly lipoprotein LptE [Helicobacter enhydrae]ANV97765.1 hypothetical protein BBW65_02640 [Helicobacter enhydrae]
MRICALVFALIFAGCGYKPLAHFARSAFGESVYVEAQINPEFPKPSSALKDMLNQAIISRLHLLLVPKDEATSIIRIGFSSISFSPIAEDQDGFATHYRANVVVKISYKTIYGEDFSVSFDGSSDYAATQAMSSVSVQIAQFEAIKLAGQQAIDQFVAKLFYQGITHDAKKSQ